MRTPSVLLAVAGLVVVTALPAGADPVAQLPSAARPHCVVTAQDLEVEAAAPPVRCYSTSAEAVVAATESGTVLGIEYEKPTFSGWSYVIATDSSEVCKDGHSYGVPRLPARYDDSFSSARTFSGCISVHWSRADYKGASIRCGCSDMRRMSDRTSSILFTRRP